MADVSLTWLGHASLRFDTPGGKRIYVDPFLNHNPKCPESELEPERVDLIALTHGHADHVGDTVALHKKFGCYVLAPVELHDWLCTHQGVDQAKGIDPNKGGTVDWEGIKITLTHAQHSSSTSDGTYAGEPVGFVFQFENGLSVYVAGDTNVFGDMALIARLYQPDIAILPIGGHYTMDPHEAAYALELLGVQTCVPVHYGTFPPLKGTPEQLRELTDADVLEPQPGETIQLPAHVTA
jgi:L-ascorbate metabolism protein UlaG (beta-lactamase superfamily)